jgi:DNA-binding XRE family transcriptional regulator
MNKPQFIKTDRGEELVVLSRRDYDILRARAGDEEAEDLMSERIIRESVARGDIALPLSVWDEIHASPSPIGPIRKWRGLTQEDLAKKAGISQGYLSELETGKKTGDIATLRAIAGSLDVSIEDVMPE